MPEDTLYPFLHALAVLATFYGLLVRSSWLTAAGLTFVTLLTAAWLWPRRHEAEVEP